MDLTRKLDKKTPMHGRIGKRYTLKNSLQGRIYRKEPTRDYNQNTFIVSVFLVKYFTRWD